MNIDDSDVLNMATAFLQANDCQGARAYLIEVDANTAVTIHYKYGNREAMWTVTMLDLLAFVWREKA